MRRTSDAILAGLAVTHGAALVVWPAAPLIAIGIWWNSNTIAHNFIHRPFFRARLPNRVFDAYQSVIMGIPQTLWRERHLAHHAGLAWKPRISASLVVEFTLILGIWLGLALTSPTYFATVYAPGYLAGLLLCAVQGHYEHAGATTSHYGRLYNLLCFNDGYHVEHHRYPGVHWSELPARVQADARSSRWPALVRWLDLASLDRLEHLVLRAPWLQALVLAAHRRAFRQLLSGLDTPRHVLIVGGGLFPRTALIPTSSCLEPGWRLSTQTRRISRSDVAPSSAQQAAPAAGSTVGALRGASRTVHTTLSSCRWPTTATGIGSMNTLRRPRSSCTTGCGGDAAKAAWSRGSCSSG